MLLRAAFLAFTVLVAALPAGAAFDCTADLQGADDEPGQKDLTEFCRDDASGGPTYDFLVSWNWDDQSWPGNNTGDACALFDTDGDLNANYALCITVGGTPAAASNLRAFSCNDTQPDRCPSAVAIASFASSCTASAMMDVNPFDATDDDTVAMCGIDLDDFGGAASAVLLDACSYPSQQPNSDPSDCIINTAKPDPCLNVVCNDNNLCTNDACDAGTCVYTPGNAGTVCRPANGVCDVEEACDGTNADCPADGFASGTICRPSAGTCDLAEACSGSSADCPGDAKSTAVCRAADGPCDVAESCNGVNDTCPADGFAGTGTVCRAEAGICDLPESCTGTSGVCPADAKSTAVCRLAAGPCDVQESCNGVDAGCPADGFESATTTCRASAGVCDLEEKCTGNGAACPADAKSTAVCRASAGVCDVAESCNGSSNDCPGDGFVGSATVCRPSGGVCDIAESCTGTAATCPADAKSTAVCRASAGVCDVTESCDGTANGCPSDKFVAGGTVCRASAGVCDLQETCTGSGALCPSDAKSTAVCRAAADVCDVAERCDGVANTCPTDLISPAGTVCRPMHGSCDVPESCTGASIACPGDAKKPAGTPCPDDANGCTDDFCDGAGVCTHPANDQNTCDDFDPCTAGDACVDGACTGTTVCEPTCRSAGFWSTHGGDGRTRQKQVAQNITGAVIQGAGGLDVCGEYVGRSVPIGDLGSALEGLCVSVEGAQVRQLYRQLVAFRLNCELSGESDDCDVILPQASACDTTCAGDPMGASVGECTARLDCFNNGGRFVPTVGCAAGECESEPWRFCGGGFPSCPPACAVVDPTTGECAQTMAQACVPFANSCHERDLCPADTTGDGIPDGPGYCFNDAGGASSQQDCHSASKNSCTIDNCP